MVSMGDGAIHPPATDLVQNIIAQVVLHYNTSNPINRNSNGKNESSPMLQIRTTGGSSD